MGFTEIPVRSSDFRRLASRFDSRYVSTRSNLIKGVAVLVSRYTQRRREAGRRQAQKRFERQRMEL